jgi:phosphate transport system substrate-binding protein
VTAFPKAALRATLAGAAGLLIASTASAVDISGAGATFPYPVYAKWAEAYKAKTGVSMNYQSIGSGGGIKQIQSKTVDFGASDMPMKPEDLEKSGLTQFPTVIGGVVPVINLKGIETGKLKLTGSLVAEIYLGKVTKWSDKAIAELNPDLKLPNQAIAPVYRSDGSGTTFIFTDYLSKVSPEWKEKVGANTSVQFPTGIGGKGNEGVAAVASRTDGAIGYVEYAYAKQNKMNYALMKNKDGQFVAPNSENFQAAAAGADWAGSKDYYVILTDQPGKQTWPISGATFILVYKKQEKPENGRQVLDFFAWAYKNGDKLAEDLDYVPLPDPVVKLIGESWRNVTGPDGKPVYTGTGS